MKIWALALAILCATPARAEDKPTPFWNRTSSSVVSLRLSHAGSGEYGDNVAASEKGGVKRDQRLGIADLPDGFYDMLLMFNGGRSCRVRDLEISNGKTFVVEDASLQACTKLRRSDQPSRRR